MQVSNKLINNVLVVEISENRLNAKVAVEFKLHLLQAIDTGSFNIVLDLTEVNFIDSSGLGAIVSGLKELGRRGDIYICGLHDSVQQMFSLTRLDKVFKIFPTRSEAIQAFR